MINCTGCGVLGMMLKSEIHGYICTKCEDVIDLGFPVFVKQFGNKKYIPWMFLHKYLIYITAQENHGQTLIELAKRGGCSAVELLAIAKCKKTSEVTQNELDALDELDALVKEWMLL